MPLTTFIIYQPANQPTYFVSSSYDLTSGLPCSSSGIISVQVRVIIIIHGQQQTDEM
jgi:hypothetical protein